MKFCSKCGQTKSRGEFHRRTGRSDGLQSACKDCYKIYQKKNRVARRGYEKSRRDEVRAWIGALKRAPCTDCGKVYPPECMDFDHQEDKKRDVSKMMMYSKQTILREVAKCDLVCANCHRTRTHGRAHEVS